TLLEYAHGSTSVVRRSHAETPAGARGYAWRRTYATAARGAQLLMVYTTGRPAEASSRTRDAQRVQRSVERYGCACAEFVTGWAISHRDCPSRRPGPVVHLAPRLAARESTVFQAVALHLPARCLGLRAVRANSLSTPKGKS